MTRWLENKVALVTGGSSGIGRATALVFTREGAKVVVAANKNVEGGEETVRMIKDAGGEAIFVQTDVSKANEVEALVNKTVETYGRLDCANNNAGIEPSYQKTADCTEENWNRIIAVDLTGVWLCMKYEILQMLKQGKGAIVNTSSAFGLVGMNNRPAYVAAKHGAVGLTKAAALDYAKEGIRVNCVCPGVITTPLLERVWAAHPERKAEVLESEPVGRPGTPEECGEATVWLCTDAASFVTGHIMAVDGGWVTR